MLTKTTYSTNSSVTLRHAGLSCVFSSLFPCHQSYCKQNEKFSFSALRLSALPTWLIEMQISWTIKMPRQRYRDRWICNLPGGPAVAPPPSHHPPGKPLETSLPATKDKGLRGSWFLITGLPSFEYQTSRLSQCCTKMKRNEDFFGDPSVSEERGQCYD